MKAVAFQESRNAIPRINSSHSKNQGHLVCRTSQVIRFYLHPYVQEKIKLSPFFRKSQFSKYYNKLRDLSYNTDIHTYGHTIYIHMDIQAERRTKDVQRSLRAQKHLIINQYWMLSGCIEHIARIYTINVCPYIKNERSGHIGLIVLYI